MSSSSRISLIYCKTGSQKEDSRWWASLRGISDSGSLRGISKSGSLRGKEGEEAEEEQEKEKVDAEHGGGLLVITVHKGQDLEGKYHTNPYAKIVYRGQEYKTKVISLQC